MFLRRWPCCSSVLSYVFSVCCLGWRVSSASFVSSLPHDLLAARCLFPVSRLLLRFLLLSCVPLGCVSAFSVGVIIASSFRSRLSGGCFLQYLCSYFLECCCRLLLFLPVPAQVLTSSSSVAAFLCLRLLCHLLSAFSVLGALVMCFIFIIRLVHQFPYGFL